MVSYCLYRHCDPYAASFPLSPQSCVRLRGTESSTRRSGEPWSCQRSSGVRWRTTGPPPHPLVSCLSTSKADTYNVHPPLSPVQGKKAQAAAAAEKAEATQRRRHKSKSWRLRSRWQLWPQTSPCPPKAVNPPPLQLASTDLRLGGGNCGPPATWVIVKEPQT